MSSEGPAFDRHEDAIVACAFGARRRPRQDQKGVLKPGDAAPDFAVGETSLHALLERGEAVVFFFPKAFTPG